MIPEESALEWAVTKTLVICFLYRTILPSYIGIMISHHKDPCEPMGIMECYTGFWRCSTWQLVSCSLRFQLKPPRVTREVASSFLGHVALGGTKDSAESGWRLAPPRKKRSSFFWQLMWSMEGQVCRTVRAGCILNQASASQLVLLTGRCSLLGFF